MDNPQTNNTSMWDFLPKDARRDDGVLRDLLASARTVTLPAHQMIFHAGAPCEYYLLVQKGRVRIQLTTETGREIVLYYVKAGESCVLTTSCLLGESRYPAEGVTETVVSAFLLDAGDFSKAVDNSAPFRRFVLANFGRRMANIIERLEQVSSIPVDIRLASALLAFDSGESSLAITHQKLATELGTAREVVSRHLKRFEDYGWVRLGRGTLEVIDPSALERLRSCRDV